MYIIGKRIKNQDAMQFSPSPYMHQTEEAAEIEARRLALQSVAHEFIIFTPLKVVRTGDAPVEVVPFQQPIVIE